MPDLRTEITEIVTGLATLGYPSLDGALEARPCEMINVGSPHWDRLMEARRCGNYAAEFQGAWSNGVAFLRAEEGLRDRRPLRVEWKGPHRTPGYDLIPADLRIDHVFLVSCKYLSRILFNASPSHLFDRCLSHRRGPEIVDWYLAAAPDAYRALYAHVREELASELQLPAQVEALTQEHRLVLKEALTGNWPGNLEASYREFCRIVSDASAERWGSNLKTPQAREEMLWRLLRFASAPYFVLGIADKEMLRLRICTPWDWRQQYTLASFDLWGDGAAGQPLVRWRASVEDREGNAELPVEGHVEVRWSHGRFRGNPEAKVYLDTPHDRVPGYIRLK